MEMTMTIKYSITNKRLSIVFVLIAVATGSVVYATNHVTNTTATGNLQSENSSGKEIEASWIGYSNLNDLTLNATDIIRGKVSSIRDSTVISGLPLTHFEVTVEQVLKGEIHPGDKIIIRQVGGTETNVKIDSEVLMKPGETYVLFLEYVQDENLYGILGGPQGRFLIQDQTINSMDNVDPRTAWVQIKVKNETIDEFINKISVLKSPEGSK